MLPPISTKPPAFGAVIITVKNPVVAAIVDRHIWELYALGRLPRYTRIDSRQRFFQYGDYHELTHPSPEKERVIANILLGEMNKGLKDLVASKLVEFKVTPHVSETWHRKALGWFECVRKNIEWAPKISF